MTILTEGIDWGPRLSGETVTYFFAPPGGRYDTPVGRVTAERWTAYERQQFEEAFATFETFTNLDFREASSRGAAELTLINWAGGRGDRSASSALRARATRWPMRILSSIRSRSRLQRLARAWSWSDRASPAWPECSRPGW